MALINVCLGQFMSALDSRSVNVALPTLSVYFDASMAYVQWIPQRCGERIGGAGTT